MRITSRRRLAVTLTIAGAALITAGSVIQALHARDATAAGVLFSVAAIVCIVAALAVLRSGRRQS